MSGIESLNHPISPSRVAELRRGIATKTLKGLRLDYDRVTKPMEELIRLARDHEVEVTTGSNLAAAALQEFDFSEEVSAGCEVGGD